MARGVRGSIVWSGWCQGNAAQNIRQQIYLALGPGSFGGRGPVGCEDGVEDGVEDGDEDRDEDDEKEVARIGGQRSNATKCQELCTVTKRW